MEKTKKSGFVVLTIIMVVIIIFTAVIFKFTYNGSNKNPNLDIGGNIIDMPSNDDNSENYLALITQYSKQVNELKSQIATITADRDKQLAEKKAEIASLEEELANSQNQDADIIASKNARITALKEVILTLEEETAAAVESYEARITSLNESLSTYESEVIQTISLPTNFKFTELGFRIIDNNNFVFYSKSHSCNLYYYNYETKTITTLPIKGSSFKSFYKTSNLLFFTAGTSLYVYNFETASLKLLSSFYYSICFVSDEHNVYICEYSGGYSIYKIATGEFEHHFITGTGYSGSVVTTAVICDNYILHSEYSNAKNLRLYNTETNSDYPLISGVEKVYCIFKLNNQYLFVCNKGFYSLDITNNTCSQIKSFSPSFCYYYELDNAVVLYSDKGLFVYDGQEVSVLSSSGNSGWEFSFFKVQDGIYYFSSTGDSTFQSLHKLDTSSNTVTNLSTSYRRLCKIEQIEHYAFVFMEEGVYVVDLDNGSFESLSFGSADYSSNRLRLESDNYIFLAPMSKSSLNSIIYYDKVNDSYGYLWTIRSFIGIKDFIVKGNLLYVMDYSKLYTFDLSVSLDNYISYFSVDSSISNLDKGIFYTLVGTVTEGKMYVRSYLKDDGTFEKEFVVIKNS